MAGNRVMVVDDSPAIHIIIERSLQANGFEVCAHAKNGKEAVELFKTSNPDFITMDITMPIMDGLEASKEILAIKPNMKIIMLSAMGDDEILEEAKKIGIKKFAKKPFKGEEIISLLKSL